MYIIFNDKGTEILRYFAEPLPEEHKEKTYIEVDEADIPEKDGYTVTAKLVNGKLEWVFEEIKPDQVEQKLTELEKASEVNLMALMELNRKLLTMGGGK